MVKNKEKQNLLFLKILSIIFLFFLIISIFPLIKNFSKQQAINSELEDLKKEIAQFERNNFDLQALIEYLQSEESLEEQARLNLNLKRQNEEVIVIEDLDFKEPVVEKINDTLKNRQRWFKYFFGV